MNTLLTYGRALVAGTLFLSFTVATMAQVPQLLNYQGRIAVNGTNFSGSGQFKFALVSASTNAALPATASGVAFYGFLVHIAVNNGGSGYLTPPAVTISDSTGIGASAYAQISGGVVTNIVITSVGFDYSGTPLIAIGAPPSQNVVGTYWSNDGTSNAGEAPASSVPLAVTKGLYSVLLGDTTLSNMTSLPVDVFGYSDVRLRIWFNDGATGFQQLTPDQRLSAVGYAMMAGAAQTVPDGSITSNKIATGAVGGSQLAQNLNISGTLNVGNLLVNGSSPSANIRYQFPTANWTGANLQTVSGGNYFLDGSITNIILPINPIIGETVRFCFPVNQSLSSYFILRQNEGQRFVGWNVVYPQNGLATPIVASMDVSHLMVGLSGQGFLISTNSGSSWGVQPGTMPWIPQSRNYRTFCISGDGSHIYVDADGRLMVSGDGGQTWMQNTNFDQQFGYPYSFSCSSNGAKAAMISSSGIYISVDAGTNWTQQASVVGPSIASSADGSKLVASTGNQLYVSINSGLGWVQQTNGLPTGGTSFSSVAASPDGSRFYLASGAGIYISTNSGLSWNQTGSGLSVQSVACSADGLIIAATTPSSIYISNDSGYSWYPRLNGTNVFGVVVSADGTELVAGGNMGLYVSMDSGDTWNVCSTLPTNPFLTPYTFSNIGPSGGASFYLSGWGGGGMAFVYLGNGMFTQITDSTFVPYLSGF